MFPSLGQGEQWEGRCSLKGSGPASQHQSSAHPQPGHEGAEAALAGEPSVLLGDARGRCCWLCPALGSLGLQPSLPAAVGPHLLCPSGCPQPWWQFSSSQESLFCWLAAEDTQDGGCPVSPPQALGPVQTRSSATPNRLGIAWSLAKRKGLLPWAVVPSPSLCFSAGLQGSSPSCCKVPEAETAQVPDPDAAGMEDWRGLGENNLLPAGHWLDEGCPC